MITLRRAFPEDHPDYARLFPELEVPDPIPPLDVWWERQGPQTIVAEARGEVVGYLWFELIGGMLYVRNVVSDPRLRRQGIGRKLLRESMRRGVDAGAVRWCLNVKDDNVAAIRLYESLGLRTEYPTRVLRLGWDLPLVQGPRTGGLTVNAHIEDAGSVERALALLGGSVQRALDQGRVAVTAVRSAEVVGFAAFDPGFPGAYPFVARDLEVAWALLEALSPHRQPFHDGSWRESGLQLVVERDEALADALVAQGAQPVFRILHLAGPLRG